MHYVLDAIELLCGLMHKNSIQSKKQSHLKAYNSEEQFMFYPHFPSLWAWGR